MSAMAMAVEFTRVVRCRECGTRQRRRDWIKWTTVIAMDENDEVIETYQVCPQCMAKHSVLQVFECA